MHWKRFNSLPIHPTKNDHVPVAVLTGEPDLAVVEVDPDGNLTRVNAAAKWIYLPAERRQEPLEGRPLAGLYPDPFADEVQRLMSLQRETGGPLLVRGIWRGHGVQTSVHAGAGGGWLLLGRRGHAPGADEVPTEHLRVDAEVIELGELSVLTPRELEVLALLGTGGTLKDAAAGLRRSVKTVESHRDNIARKLGLSRRGELVRVVERSGLRRSDMGLARLILAGSATRATELGTQAAK